MASLTALELIAFMSCSTAAVEESATPAKQENFLSRLVKITTTKFAEHAPPSLADHLHLRHSKDPVDKGWLPDLIGLPDPDQMIHLTESMIGTMAQEKEPECKAIDPKLKKLIFQHFSVYQHLVNAQGIYLNDNVAHQWAHVLGMILKESSGDTTNISDMTGRTISTYEPTTNLPQWQKILNVPKQSRIKINFQTNYGLAQLSSDRLVAAFQLAQDQGYSTEYLEGREGALSARKIKLNTAIAIRRLVWFYQDFAQGRLTQSDTRIRPENINKPEFSSRYEAGLNQALLYCGTPIVFLEGNGNDKKALEDAMASIAYCKLGNSQIGYGGNEMESTCFAAWITLCPALNVDIATLTPLSYFATRDQPAVCESTFKKMIIKKPEHF